MGQLLHNQTSALTIALKAIVYILIAILSWVVVSAILSLVGVLN
ncbi:hypothetical protein [Joostella sp. CR20]